MFSYAPAEREAEGSFTRKFCKHSARIMPVCAALRVPTCPPYGISTSRRNSDRDSENSRPIGDQSDSVFINDQRRKREETQGKKRGAVLNAIRGATRRAPLLGGARISLLRNN